MLKERKKEREKGWGTSRTRSACDSDPFVWRRALEQLAGVFIVAIANTSELNRIRLFIFVIGPYSRTMSFRMPWDNKMEWLVFRWSDDNGSLQGMNNLSAWLNIFIWALTQPLSAIPISTCSQTKVTRSFSCQFHCHSNENWCGASFSPLDPCCCFVRLRTETMQWATNATKDQWLRWRQPCLSRVSAHHSLKSGRETERLVCFAGVDQIFLHISFPHSFRMRTEYRAYLSF